MMSGVSYFAMLRALQQLCPQFDEANSYMDELYLFLKEF